MIKYNRYLFFIILLFFTFFLKVNAKAYETYKIGDTVTYNGIKFYVIENSEEEQSYVTLLKAEPLSVDEVNAYGEGHVNMHISVDPMDFHPNGYGRVAYYTSEDCGYDADGNSLSDGCATDYEKSDVKYVVDAWVKAKFEVNDLEKDKMGYEARLLTFNELVDNFGYTLGVVGTVYIPSNEATSIWINGSNYDYWTMSSYEDSKSYVWDIESDCVYANFVNLNNKYIGGVIRPVITLRKQNYDAIDKCNNSENSENDELKDNHNNNQIIKVQDTHLSKKNIFIVIGVALIIASIIARYIIIKRLKNNKIDNTA